MTVAQFLTNALSDTGVTNREVQALVREEFRQRLRHYCEALLTDVQDVRTISRNPEYELFEIRMKIRGIGLLRLYFIEPGILGNVGIGLHLHLKNTDMGTSRDVNSAQDAEIDVATRRCAAGVATQWDFGMG